MTGSVTSEQADELRKLARCAKALAGRIVLAQEFHKPPTSELPRRSLRDVITQLKEVAHVIEAYLGPE